MISGAYENARKISIAFVVVTTYFILMEKWQKYKFLWV